LIVANMTLVAIPGTRKRQDDERDEYRQCMLVNAIAASFISLPMIGGYWVVTTLVGVV
jgi:hypothetical protein